MATRRERVIVTRPAPIGGLNARDGLMGMADEDAVRLVNWIPDTYGLRCRKGFREWAVNFPGDLPVQSVVSYFSSTTQFPTGEYLEIPTTMPGKLFAATPAAIYDITAQTNTPAPVFILSGGAQAGWFSSQMLANSGGTFLLVASEDDGYHYYDGTNWIKPVAGALPGQIDGANPALFCHVSIWKKRAWFVEKNSTRAWYLGTDAITGPVEEFDFGPLFKRGGHLSYIANWTIDAGEGIDDLMVVVSSNGDVLVYKGTDPTSSATFSLVGAWSVGQIPVGRRAYCQYGGDLVIVSADGAFPMSYVTRGGSALLQATAKEYSSKIRSAIGADLRSSFTLRGWDVMVHPSERLILVNTPDLKNRRNTQYSLSTTLNQWSIFNDIPAYSFGVSGGYGFAGTKNGKVLLLFADLFDAVPYSTATGDGIYGLVQQSYSAFGTPGLTKQFMMVRPNFLSLVAPGSRASVEVNYALADRDFSPAYPVGGVSQWGVGVWGTARWTSAPRAFSDWVGVAALGHSGGAVLQTASIGDTVLSSIDYMLRSGGPL
jgi:hypothetical protein